MRKYSAISEKHDNGFSNGYRNWLLHARYVRGEHALCLDLADEHLKETGNTHKYAHFIKGLVLADAGRLQDALERFHSCIRLQPQDPEPVKQVAKCLSRQGRYQLSLEAYLEADKLTKHPDADIYCAIAECAWNLRDPQRGVEWARSAVQAGGGERAGALLAKLLLACDDISGALDAYDHALSNGNRNWLLHARYVRGEHALCLDLADEHLKETGNTHKYAHFIKGLVLADAGRLQDALERFHSCIRLQPQDPEPVKQVAKCLSRQGRYQLSLEAYLEADKLTKHPDADIYCAIAECAWNLGDPQRGVEWARSAVQAGGGERAGALLAKLLLACDDISGALDAYDHALSVYACGADTLAAAGALSLRAGDPRRAFQLLGAALAQQPSQHAAALALAAMMLQHKDIDAALSRLKTALTAHPACVAAHTNLGLALLAKKKYIAALTCLQRAVWAAPLSGRAAHDLGLALLVCKRTSSAFCRLATAAALQPSQPYTVLLIGVALERLGDSRADAAYAQAAALASEDPLIRLNLAGRHARAGRISEAVEEARSTAQLLQRDEKPNAQISSSLATLLALLRDAGVNISRMSELPQPAQESQVLATSSKEDLNCNDDEQLSTDEV